jgi:ParB-like chromosome segregation protein Spo0J
MEISIAGVEVDDKVYVRTQVNDDLVAEYAERMLAGDQFPAVIVYEEGGHRRLSDGRHRLLAAHRIGKTAIEAEVRHGTAEESLWFALGAGRDYGARLTNADVAHAILLALRELPDKSHRLIAERLGCSHSYVSKIAAERCTPESAPAGGIGGDDCDRRAEQVSTSGHLPQFEEAVDRPAEADPEHDADINQPARVRGRDGKSYPATRPRAVTTTSRAGRGGSRPDPLTQLKHLWELAPPEVRKAFRSWVDAQEQSENGAIDLLHDAEYGAIEVGSASATTGISGL